MLIIAGLGNPGKKHSRNRHNIGFMVLDAWAEKKALTWQNNKKLQADIAKSNGFLLLKPQTYMNNSGEAVAKTMAYYKLLPKTLGLIKNKDSDLLKKLIIIHDDIDLDFGKYKISFNSRSAGHRGVESIIKHIKTKNFTRIRIGINNGKPKEEALKNYVLNNFNKNELELIKPLIQEIINHINSHILSE